MKEREVSGISESEVGRYPLHWLHGGLGFGRNFQHFQQYSNASKEAPAKRGEGGMLEG